MDKARKTPQTGQEGGVDEISNGKATKFIEERVSKRKPMGKLDRRLRHFASGKSSHCLEAYKDADSCTHTTISDLQKRHGIYFDRQWIKVPNRYGGETRVKEYWLEGENLKRARKLSGLEDYS